MISPPKKGLKNSPYTRVYTVLAIKWNSSRNGHKTITLKPFFNFGFFGMALIYGVVFAIPWHYNRNPFDDQQGDF